VRSLNVVAVEGDDSTQGAVAHSGATGPHSTLTERRSRVTVGRPGVTGDQWR
jgi:hypothetical protein